MAASRQNQIERPSIVPEPRLLFLIVGDPDGRIVHRLRAALHALGAGVIVLDWPPAKADDGRRDAIVTPDTVVFIADSALVAMVNAVGEESLSEFFDDFEEWKVLPFWIMDGDHGKLGERVKVRSHPDAAHIALGKRVTQVKIDDTAKAIVAHTLASVERARVARETEKLKSKPRVRKSAAATTEMPDSFSLEGINTIGDFFAWPGTNGGLNEWDKKAFRLGAALVEFVSEELDSWAVLCGYLLTAPLDGNRAETAITKAVWYSYATGSAEAAPLNIVDFWAALKITDVQLELQSEAADMPQIDKTEMSLRLWNLIKWSVEVSRQAGRPRPFYTRHLLACMITQLTDKRDPSVHFGLAGLGVDSGRVARMFRRWLATYRKFDDKKVLDELLGPSSVTGQAVMWPRHWRPERPDGEETEITFLGDSNLEQWRVDNMRQFLGMLQEREAVLEELMEDPAQDQIEIASELITTRNEIERVVSELANWPSEIPEKRQLSASGWRDHVARLDPGSVHFEDHQPVRDALGINDYARRFARVIALRATELPLSIGLFGPWGSGKTYFMKLLQQEIKALPSSAQDEWCEEVAAIRFNAWHYLDSNLWASLVTEIFDQMLEHLAGPNRDEAQRLETAKKLMQQIEKGKGAVSEMKVEVAALTEEKERAEAEIVEEGKRLRIAEKQAAKAERAIARRLDLVGPALREILQSKESQQALQTLHLEKAVGSWQRLQARFAELHSLGGRIRALGSVMGSGWWGFWSLIALLALLWAGPMLIGLASAHLLHDGGTVDSVKMAVGSVSGALISIAGWLGAQVTRLKKLFGQVDKIEKAARKARAQNETSKTMARLRARAASLAKEQTEAAEKLQVARAKVRKLEEDLREIRPERRLYRFIEERAAAKDYRQHLGLVSLVRRDFRALSDLFRAQKDGVSAWKELLGGGARSIDRVVLYVDDLDRCQPQRVVEVLEAVHLLLDFPLFVAVVAVDPRWVKQSLRTHYARLLGGAEETRHVPGGGGHYDGGAPGEPAPVRAGERQATPLDYLEKIFHIPFHLPAMTQDGYVGLMKSLAGEIGTQARTVENGRSHGELTLDAPLVAKDAGGGSRGERLLAEEKPATLSEDSVEVEDEVDEEPVADAAVKAQSLGFVELEDWDLAGLNLFQDLIHTPRGAKRFINTYRLVRAGVADDEEWHRFRANDGGSAECRVAMFLLAAAAGHPSVAREWFQVIRQSTPGELAVFGDGAGERPEDWSEFKKVFDMVWSAKLPTRELCVKWLERVERFSF